MNEILISSCKDRFSFIFFIGNNQIKMQQTIEKSKLSVKISLTYLFLDHTKWLDRRRMIVDRNSAPRKQQLITEIIHVVVFAV